MKRGIYVVLILLGIWLLVEVILMFSRSGRYEVTDAVPEDAMCVVRIPSVNHVYKNIRGNKIWQSIKEYPYFAEYQEYLDLFDTLCEEYPVIQKKMTEREFVISIHPVSAKDFDYLLVCDLGQWNFLKRFEGTIASLVASDSVSFTRDIRGRKGVHLLDWYGYDYYFTIHSNLLLVSPQLALVEKGMAQARQEEKREINFAGGDVGIHVDHVRLQHFLASMTTPDFKATENPLLTETVVALQAAPDHLLFAGSTLPDSSFIPLFDRIRHLKGECSTVGQVVGQNTAAYVSFCFPRFADLKQTLLDFYKEENPAEYKEFEGYLQRINKFIDVDLLDLLTSWIGKEVALIKPASGSEKRLDNFILAIHSEDINFARDQLAYLTEQVRRKTPIRDREVEYAGYTIHYFSLKGFFNAFLSKMFHSWDRPYFTFIGDYVVFSNMPESLIDMIRHYSVNKTLANNETYTHWMNKLDGNATLYGYINTPEAYNLVHNSLAADSRKELEMNRDVFLGFETIGFALKSREKDFATRIIASYNEKSPAEYQQKALHEDYEKLVDLIEAGYYYPVIPESIQVSAHESYTYEGPGWSVTGKLDRGDPDDTWRIESNQGVLLGQLPYRRGKLHGEAEFFYPDNTIQCRVEYNKGQMNSYKEFFPDGTLKVEINYNKGVRHGDVKYYYPSGHLYCEGRYKKGQQTGKWQHYRVTGEKIY